VPGGTFFRSYDAVNYTSKSYPATVSAFIPDVYEITVGRFRKFVAGYPNNRPAAGAGKNPNNPQDPGWNTAWHAAMPSTQEDLIKGIKCNPSKMTWTDTPGGNEAFPMTCITWLEAFAFCIWDGGRLPTEAEWNYMAAGGGAADGQRVFAWSSPSTSTTLDNTFTVFCGSSCVPKAVGSRSPKGDGKWGQADLTGNAWEWTLDVFADPYPSPCSNCANFEGSVTDRTSRGGACNSQTPSSTTPQLYVGHREKRSALDRAWFVGARCVRN
jgi:formylglycine-generating enzyme required for sulfatase activity